MARKGRSAKRTGDINNIIADLESGDVLSVDLEGMVAPVESRVQKVYKSSVSTWAIARLVMLRDDMGNQDALLAMTVKAPEQYKFDAQFNALFSDGARKAQNVESLKVIG